MLIPGKPLEGDEFSKTALERGRLTAGIETCGPFYSFYTVHLVEIQINWRNL